MKIDLTIDKKRRQRAIQQVREKNIIIPTYAQMKDPSSYSRKCEAGTYKDWPVGCEPEKSLSHHMA